VDLLNYLLIEGIEHLVEFALMLEELAVADLELTSVVCMVYNAL
jgi:hypothetical protein